MNAVEKALELLVAFQDHHPTWGVRELSSHLGFSPATVQRILQSLKGYGFVEQDPATRHYRLGNVYFRFLHTLQHAFPITRAATPHMQRLLSQTRETVHLNVIDAQERICIDTLESFQNLKASMPIGSRSPLYAGASSKCLLAHSSHEFIRSYLQQTALAPVTQNTITEKSTLMAELKTIRSDGYALSLGERNKGLGSISAPVFNHQGLLIGVISLAIPEIRYKDLKHRSLCLTGLLEAAANLSREMGYLPGH
jgi:IclR family transcriptional regulator, KDG regulon repressor